MDKGMGGVRGDCQVHEMGEEREDQARVTLLTAACEVCVTQLSNDAHSVKDSALPLSHPSILPPLTPLAVCRCPGVATAWG